MPQSIHIPATLGRCDACHRGVHQLSATPATYVFVLATRTITVTGLPVYVCAVCGGTTMSVLLLAAVERCLRADPTRVSPVAFGDLPLTQQKAS